MKSWFHALNSFRELFAATVLAFFVDVKFVGRAFQIWRSMRHNDINIFRNGMCTRTEAIFGTVCECVPVEFWCIGRGVYREFGFMFECESVCAFLQIVDNVFFSVL